MPVNTTSPYFNAGMSSLTDNAFNGTVTEYIHRLDGQSSNEYRKYVERTPYLNVTKRTGTALTGAILRKPYNTDFETEEVVVYGNLNFKEFLNESLVDVMINGRIGMLCDYSDEYQNPYIVTYPNNAITNWRMDHNTLTLVIVREDYYKPKDDDLYDTELVEKYREMYIDENGYYAVRLWEQERNNEFKVVDEIEPTIRGQRMDYIPFVFCNTRDTSPTVTEPLLHNLAQLNVSHYRTSADIEHAAHYTALPQAWLAGDLQEETATLQIGTNTVWQLEKDSKVGYLEFGGAGIKSLQEILQHKEEMMADIGSRLLQGKKGVESVEALRIRSGSESSALVTIACSLESAITQILHYYYNWMGADGHDNYLFELSKDFTNVKMGPQELKALVDAFIAGTISEDTFLMNLYEGEIVDDIDEEKAARSLEDEEKEEKEPPEVEVVEVVNVDE